MPRGFGQVFADITRERAKLAETSPRDAQRWKKRVERLLELYAEGLELAAKASAAAPVL